MGKMVYIVAWCRTKSYGLPMFEPLLPATTATRPAALGSTFRAAREGAGLSVRQVAARAGRSHATVSRWERGERDIAEETYQRLMQVLQDHLAGGSAA